MFEPYMIVYSKCELRVNNFYAVKERIPELQRFAAIDSINDYIGASEIAKNYLSESFIAKCNCTRFKGKLGCQLSHMILAREFHANSGVDWLLVLEDDVKVKDNYSTELVNSLIQEAGDNFSYFIDLCMHPDFMDDQKNAPKLTPNMHQLVPQWWACSYLIHKSAISLTNNERWDIFNDLFYYERIPIFNSLAYIDGLFECKGAKDCHDKESEFGSLIWGSPHLGQG